MTPPPDHRPVPFNRPSGPLGTPTPPAVAPSYRPPTPTGTGSPPPAGARYGEPTRPAAPTPSRPQAGPISRGSIRSRFLPQSAAPEIESAIVIDRSSLLANRRTSATPEIPRNRKIAGNLPDWYPEPPGELLVDRSRRP